MQNAALGVVLSVAKRPFIVWHNRDGEHLVGILHPPGDDSVAGLVVGNRLALPFLQHAPLLHHFFRRLLHVSLVHLGQVLGKRLEGGLLAYP